MERVPEIMHGYGTAHEGGDALRENEERYRMLTEAAQDIIFVVGLDGNIQYVNSFGARQLGCRSEEVIGRPRSTLFPESSGQYEAALERVFETGEPAYLEHRTAFHEREEWLYTSLAALRGESGHITAVLGISRDITGLVRMREELRTLSLVDELTGLYNRRAFSPLALQQLKLADRTRRPVAILLADLDGLKQINDTFGHRQGDEALKAAANVLREAFRQSDIIARIGGDEFVVLAIGANPEDADTLAVRLSTALRVDNARSARGYQLSMSFGIAHYHPDSRRSIDELLASADELMYEQKRSRGAV